MEGSELTSIAFEKAKEVMRMVTNDRGFKASGDDIGYHQIWARDSGISMIGALMLDECVEPAKRSLVTLGRVQSATGWIPNNFDLHTNQPEHWGPDGYDNCAWYVAGFGLVYRRTNDTDFIREHWPSIVKALTWLEYHESSQGMVYMGESGDWMDVFSVRGHGLYLNLSYLIALREAERMAGALGEKDTARKAGQKARGLVEAFNERFWFDPEHTFWRLVKNRRITSDWEHTHLLYLARIVKMPFYLAFLGHRDAGSYFDACANFLAILTGVANKDRSQAILNFVYEEGLDEPYPTKTIYPTVHRNDENWRAYFTTLNLNLPHQYQNGGVWPFIGALEVMAQVKAGHVSEAHETLIKLAKANQLGHGVEWEFNEWVHGRTGRPAGKKHQTWSAALYLAAYRAVTEGVLPDIFK